MAAIALVHAFSGIQPRHLHSFSKTTLLGHSLGGPEVSTAPRLPLGQLAHAAELIQSFCTEWIKQIESLKR
jgi:hypothetical protein